MEKALITFENKNDDTFCIFGITSNDELTIKQVDCELIKLENSINIKIDDIDDFIEKIIKLRDMVNEKRN